MTKNTKREFGPLEANIISRLSYEKKIIVTNKELDSIFNLSAVDRAKLVSRLKRKNILIPVKRGYYVFSPLDSGPSGRGVDEFLIPSIYCKENSYYIGYSPMYNYYGMTEQLFRTVYVINTSFRKSKKIMGINYKFIKVPKSRIYGATEIKVKDQSIMISDKERTLLDLLYYPNPVGGIKQAENIFITIIKNKNCDLNKLVQYAVVFPNITLRKRVGVLLEGLNVESSLLQPLEKSIKNSAISSFSNNRKGKINQRWKVIVNYDS